jgi:hypothetical protein
MLMEAYRSSDDFSDKSPRTRSDYQKVLDYLKPIESEYSWRE